MIRIYLDQNKLIDLARATAGHQNGAKYKGVRGLLKKCVGEGLVVVPMSSAQIIETAATGQLSRREAVLGELSALSRGYALRPSGTVLQLEVESQLRRWAAEATDTVQATVRPQALGRGPIDAVHGPSGEHGGAIDGLLRALMATPAGTAMAVEAIHALSKTDGWGAEDEESLKQTAAINEKRAKYRQGAKSKADLYDAYRTNAFHQFYRPARRRALEGLLTRGFDFTSFAPVGDWVAALAELPSLDVWITCCVESVWDFDRAQEVNDIQDQEFLQIAVPYCDVIVVEKYWGNLVKRSGLAERYGTRVLRHLDDLVPELEALQGGGASGKA